MTGCLTGKVSQTIEKCELEVQSIHLWLLVNFFFPLEKKKAFGNINASPLFTLKEGDAME